MIIRKRSFIKIKLKLASGQMAPSYKYSVAFDVASSHTYEVLAPAVCSNFLD
jgi:hypothetical protein